MKNIALILLLLALYGTSCRSIAHTLFGKKTPHEQYADKLEDKGLEDTPEGRQWLAASRDALSRPQPVSLPYRQHGYFHSGKPRALGLQFKARQGEQLTFHLAAKEGAGPVLYADLFHQEGGTATPVPVRLAEKGSTEFSFDVAESGTYLLRLQPELNSSGAYSLSVSTGPSLSFPVSGNKAKAGSFWGASRDGGKRRHEGIDIFAPRLTPVVAAADGYVTGVKEGGLGGKTVWMRLPDRNIYLYYAHLDKQLVQEGQSVKKGEVLGLVGNTGNARTTPSHLHFGVYTPNGPVDPLPFIDQVAREAPALAARDLKGALKLVKAYKEPDGTTLKVNTLLVPLAATAQGYIAETPEGILVRVPFASAKKVPAPETEVADRKRR